MAGPKKGGLAALLMARPRDGAPPGDEGDAPPGDGPEGGDPVEQAMTDFLEGVKSNDPQAMADALHAAFDAMQ